ncbi:site-specific integrase [Conexibacter woesei]|uniref:site-specific integrase n=1 Tax=Conexibacter woesei TaxID=191495 RepID=UPI00047E6570|nr:site-specific integrase [Conexibacter woesei]
MEAIHLQDADLRLGTARSASSETAREHLDTAAADFKFQVDRDGERVRLKTEESKSRVPLSRAAVILLRKHKAASEHTRPKDYVLCTDHGGPLHQRNVLRALYRAQEEARKPDGRPTFPELFEHDGDELVVDAEGAYVLNGTPRRELNLPHFHSLRHGAAMNCEDAEEARDLLRHKNTNVTNAVYRPTSRRSAGRHCEPSSTPASSARAGRRCGPNSTPQPSALSGVQRGATQRAPGALRAVPVVRRASSARR